jgi:hypothetical protein
MLIYINGMQFPSKALSEMRLIRETYALDRSSTISIEIDVKSTILASIREYMDTYNDVRVSIILPRIVPVKDILPDPVLKWIYALSTDDIWALHMAAHTLGYEGLFQVTSLVLSEILDVPSLLAM